MIGKFATVCILSILKGFLYVKEKLFQFVSIAKKQNITSYLEQVNSSEYKNVNIELEENGILPTLGSEYSAGFDFYYTGEDIIVIPPGKHKLIPLNIKLELNKDTVLLFYTKSSYAVKGIFVLGGVIDSDYRGTIGAILMNLGDSEVEIEPYMKVCQGIIHNIESRMVRFNQVDSIVSKTNRGEGGFGSTGKTIK